MKNVAQNVLKLSLVTSVATGVVVAANPNQAQAAQLSAGSQLDIAGVADSSLTGIDFQDVFAVGFDPVVALSGTGDFASIPLGILFGEISDVDLLTATPLPSWLTFGPSSLGVPDFVFDLASISVGSPTQYLISGTVSGTGFDPTPFTGELTTQVLQTGSRAFSGTITAVPTPALLPGIAMMGVNVLRKRKKKMATT